jgi:EmrB/QacA subfamily drug resistance transporter
MELASGGRQRATSLPLVLVLTSISFFMVALDALVVVTALPAIHASIGGSIATLEWAVNAYGLTFASGIITAAAVGDRFGHRLVYGAGLVLFTVSSAACALAPNASLLIAARAVQGLGAAAVTPLALTILASTFPVERRGAIVGIFGGIGGLAVAGGPLVGGIVVQGLDWHWIFWINVPIGLAAAIGSVLFLPAGRGAAPATRLDLPAVPLVAGGAAAIAWALIQVGDSGWSDPKAVTGFIVGALLMTGLVLRERRAAEPMLPPRLLASRTFSAANVAAFCMSGAVFSAAFLTAQYFQLGLGYSPLAAGLRLLPWTATPMVVAPLAGVLADRIGTRPLLVAGLLMQGAGLAWVASLAATTAGGGYGRFVIPLIVAGIGVSMALPTAPTATLGAVPASDVGRASGVSNTMQRFGGAFGIAIVSAVFAAHGHFGSAASFTSGYRPAMVVSAVISLAGAVAAVAVGRRSAASAGAQAQVQPPSVVPSHHAADDVPAAANMGADAS